MAGKTAGNTATKKTVKKTVKKVPSVVNGRSSTIDAFLKANEGMIGDLTRELEFCSTGSWIVDREIGDGSGEGGAGGFPRGCMTEVFGREACGKTTLVLEAAVECQRQGGLVLFADFEHSLRAQRKYLDRLGLDYLDSNKFILLQPDDLESGTKAIFEATIALKPDLIIVDSVAAMIPKAFTTGDVEEAIKLGLHAKLVGVFIGMMNKILHKCNPALVFINQLRAKIGGPTNGPTTDTTGGYAFKFYMHLRIQMAVVSKVSKDTTSDLTGKSTSDVSAQNVKVTVVKNKIDKPFRSEEIVIRFGTGIDNLTSKIDLAIKKKVIVQSGSWLSYTSEENSDFDFKVQGKGKARAHLEKFTEVMEDIEDRLFLDVDVNSYLKAKEDGEIEEGDVDDDMQAALKEMVASMESISGGSGSESLSLPE